MNKTGILALWGFLVVLFSSFAGAIIAHNSNRHVGDGGAVGILIGLVIDLVLFTVYSTINLVVKPPQTLPPAPVAEPNPEVVRQVNDIVNSGREPALIVEELRRLTEARP